MTPELLSDEQVIAATTELALENVRARSPEAPKLLSLCSFMAADDIPRGMLFRSAVELPPALRGPVADPASLQNAIKVLRQYELLRTRADGLHVHRSLQAAVRDGLSDEEREGWATGAARMVLHSFPERSEDSRNWHWAARLLPHAMATADHLDALGLEPRLAVRLRERSARYLIPQGQLDLANGLLVLALESAGQIEPQGALYATVLNRYAVLEHDKGHFNDARRDAEHALAIHLKTAGGRIAAASKPVGGPEEQAFAGANVAPDPDPDVAEDLMSLGVIAQSQGMPGEAQTHLRVAYDMLREVYSDADPRVADVLTMLFGLYIGEGMVADAVEALRRANTILEERYGAEDDDVVDNRRLLEIMTEPDDPEEKARDVLRRSEKTFGPLHPRTADASRLLAALLRRLGQADEAVRMVNRALKIDRGNYGTRHFRVGSGLVDLMALEVTMGDLDAAAERLREVTDIVLAAPSRDRAPTLRLARLGDALFDLAQLEDGMPFIRRARDVLDEAFAQDAELIALGREIVAKAFAIAGDERLRNRDLVNAGAEYEEGLDLALQTTENWLDDALFHVRLAFVAAMTEDTGAMRAHFREALRCFALGGYARPIWQLVAACSRLRAVTGPLPLAEHQLSTLVQEAIEGGEVAEFRGRLTAAIPDDWFVKESATVLAPDGQANVIASSEPLDPSIQTDQYASVQGDLLRNGKDFPEYEEKSFEAIPIFGGRFGYMRHFEWTPPNGDRVAQLQLYYADNGRGYTATATTPATAFPERELVLRQILAGLRIAAD
jgi:tetratricopeptide (TPR) repeat protein